MYSLSTIMHNMGRTRRMALFGVLLFYVPDHNIWQKKNHKLDKLCHKLAHGKYPHNDKIANRKSVIKFDGKLCYPTL